MSTALDRIAAARVVPVLTADAADDAERAGEALLAGGLPVVEVAFRTAAAAGSIRRLAALGGLTVGAGTVLTPEQLEAALDAGAVFAVAPGTSADVVGLAHRAGIPFLPGVATPTEIERAAGLGCPAVKVFPASLVGGPAFLRAVAPVYPHVRFLPTGGVSPENLASYLALPCVLACAGTWICERTLLAEGRFDEIERRARQAAALAAGSGGGP